MMMVMMMMMPELVPGRLFTTRCCYDDGDDGDDDDDARTCARKTFHNQVFLLNCCDLLNNRDFCAYTCGMVDNATMNHHQ